MRSPFVARSIAEMNTSLARRIVKDLRVEIVRAERHGDHHAVVDGLVLQDGLGESLLLAVVVRNLTENGVQRLVQRAVVNH